MKLIRCFSAPRLARRSLAAALTAGTLLALASSASAGSQVWWTNAVNYGANPGLTAAIARANLDGSNTTAVVAKSSTSYVGGLTVDLWSGKMFYMRVNRQIVSANLDGSNPQVILSGNDVGVDEAWDLVYDRQTNYLYWLSGQYSNNSMSIRRARPDGSSPSELYSQAQLGNIRSYDIAVVPEISRIYWGNYDGGAPIRYANLDGSGSIQSITPSCGGAATNAGLAISVDPSTDRMFAVIAGGSPSGWFRVRKTKLDGTNCETLTKIWSSINDDAIVLDRANNKLITGNFGTGSGGPIGLWSISDSTPQDAPASALIPDALPTTLSPANALMVEPPKPIGASASVAASGTTPGSVLTLTAMVDTFAPDEPGIRVYRGVTTKSTAWYRDGVLLPGETGSTLTATEPGVYKAVISASNLAGSVETTSNEVTIAVEPTPTPKPKLRLSVTTPKKTKAGKDFQVTVKTSNLETSSPTTASNVKTCARLPKGIFVVKSGGGKVSGRTVCWTRSSLAAGKSVTYSATVRSSRSRSGSIKVNGTASASNGSGATVKASGSSRVRVIDPKKPKPKPPTG